MTRHSRRFLPALSLDLRVSQYLGMEVSLAPSVSRIRFGPAAFQRCLVAAVTVPERFPGRICSCGARRMNSAELSRRDSKAYSIVCATARSRCVLRQISGLDRESATPRHPRECQWASMPLLALTNTALARTCDHNYGTTRSCLISPEAWG